MRDKNSKVDGTDPPASFKGGGSSVVMIDEVGGQEESRHYKRRNHTVSVSGNFAPSNHQETDGQKHCADCIQDGIHRG